MCGQSIRLLEIVVVVFGAAWVPTKWMSFRAGVLDRMMSTDAGVKYYDDTWGRWRTGWNGRR